MKGGIEGEFEGKVYPLAVGLKEGQRRLHLLGEGLDYDIANGFLIATEADGGTLRVPLENLAFVAAPFILVVNPPK